MAEKIVQHFHKKILHGGVVLKMAAVRDKYWVLKLRQLTKRIIRNCYGCKWYPIKPYDTPPPGQLTKNRTTEIRAFQLIDIDFAGPIIYKKGNSKQNKSYILLFTCSACRTVHIDQVPNKSPEEFRTTFKKSTALRGAPENIYSDNAKTSIA